MMMEAATFIFPFFSSSDERNETNARTKTKKAVCLLGWLVGEEERKTKNDDDDDVVGPQLLRPRLVRSVVSMPLLSAAAAAVGGVVAVAVCVVGGVRLCVAGEGGAAGVPCGCRAS